MAGITAGGVNTGPAADNAGRRRAAGIYGAIITAAILAAAGGHLPTGALVVSVVVTLLVYWLAEEYAELLGEATGGKLPSRAHIRQALAATWPMVSASYLPLLALVLARAAGASALVAANVGLVATILLLTAHAWTAARAAKLHGWRLLFAVSVAAALGLTMVALKDLVLLHLH